MLRKLLDLAQTDAAKVKVDFENSCESVTWVLYEWVIEVNRKFAKHTFTQNDEHRLDLCESLVMTSVVAM